MASNHYTPLVDGPSTLANAATFNSRFSELDVAIDATSAEAWQQVHILTGGNVVTLANGAAAAGQNILDVDSTTGFVPNMRVEYALVGGAPEWNQVGAVTSATRLTLVNNIGTGGIADNGVISGSSQAVYAANKGVYNVVTFGATGDGVTDDTAAIQAAINAAAVAGGAVVIPPGSYVTSATINLAAYVTLRGTQGNDTGKGTRILPNARTFPAITVTGAKYFWHIQDLAIDYVTAATATATAIGIDLSASGVDVPALFTIERISIQNAYRGIQVVDNVFMYRISDIKITSVYDYGVHIAGGTTATLTNIYVQIAGGGFYIYGVVELTVINCASDRITVTAQNANSFMLCTGQMLGFSAEECSVTGPYAIIYFGACNMLVHSYSGGPNTFSSASGYTATFKINDGVPYMQIINCGSATDIVTSGDYYAVVFGEGYNVAYGNKWSAPATGVWVTKYLRAGGQSYIWDTAFVSGSFQTFTASDATPSVANGNLFKTSNAIATTITAFDDGLNGQPIKVIFADALTTIDFSGTTLKGNVGADWLPGSGDWLEGTFDGTNWYCAVHDCTA